MSCLTIHRPRLNRLLTQRISESRPALRIISLACVANGARNHLLLHVSTHNATLQETCVEQTFGQADRAWASIQAGGLMKIGIVAGID